MVDSLNSISLPREFCLNSRTYNIPKLELDIQEEKREIDMESHEWGIADKKVIAFRTEGILSYKVLYRENQAQ